MNYDFGQNWERFSAALSRQDYLAARDSLRNLAGDLRGKTFLDIGCGSGIFAVAASSLGASEVVGIDRDPKCVQVSLDNLPKISAWDGSAGAQNIKFLQKSILADVGDLGTFDVVYGWGVLHHTGRMYDSFHKAASLVKKNGLLIISVYNRHFTSGFWLNVKRLYNTGPKILKITLFYCVYILKFLGVAITQGKNPLGKDRGMKFYYDVRDWVGGYPYEYASVDEVVQYFKNKDFETIKINKTAGFTGCNEFVFRRRT
ncbi:MAG: methyltransferase domain-containing protein [Candidatus Omnitrophica bacterium]|nr:methyltransferase domain-containing protein [Candidatus Omnitrophota bacterium]